MRAARADLPVEDLCAEDAANNGELVETDQASTPLRGTDFGDVHRRDVRCESDCKSTDDAPRDECGERVGPACEHGRDSEECAGQQQGTLAAEPIANHTGEERSCEAAHQGATVGPAD